MSPHPSPTAPVLFWFPILLTCVTRPLFVSHPNIVFLVLWFNTDDRELWNWRLWNWGSWSWGLRDSLCTVRVVTTLSTMSLSLWDTASPFNNAVEPAKETVEAVFFGWDSRDNGSGLRVLFDYILCSEDPWLDYKWAKLFFDVLFAGGGNR